MELKAHMKEHTESNQLECPICDQVLKGNEMKAHLRVHSKKLFECDICYKKYTTKPNLNRHQKSHEKPKQLQYSQQPIYNSLHCEYCGIEYTQKRTLELHLRIDHALEEIKKISPKDQKNIIDLKAIDCVICLIQYNDLDVMKYHFISEHSDDMDAYEFMLETTCNICHDIFDSADDLSTHYKADHLKYTCDICSQIFDNKKLLVMHMKLHIHNIKHPFKMPLYEVHLKRENTVQQKLNELDHRVHSESRLHCYNCSRTFATLSELNLHSQTHSKQYRYTFKCSICSRKYRNNVQLTEHMHTVHFKYEED